MIKKSVITWVVVGICSFLCMALVFPNDIVKIVGKEPTINDSTVVIMTRQNLIFNESETIEIKGVDSGRAIVDFLNENRYVKSNKSSSDFDFIEYYDITIFTDGNQVINCSVKSSEHVSFFNESQVESLYMVAWNKLDTNFLKKFFI